MYATVGVCDGIDHEAGVRLDVAGSPLGAADAPDHVAGGRF
jgi:hypothetical protein